MFGYYLNIQNCIKQTNGQNVIEMIQHVINISQS